MVVEYLKPKPSGGTGMKIVLPSAEIITEENPLKRIEIAGRVCYKSEDKITGESAPVFVQKLLDRGTCPHWNTRES